MIDLPNQKSERKFFISIFGLPNNSSSSKVDHRRYYNPHNKNVGKWKVKKRIKGGADADDMHSVDGISGGTITSDGVADMLAERFKQYLPFFNKKNSQMKELLSKSEIVVNSL